MTLDFAKVGDIIRDVAATEILPRFQQLAASDIQTKTGPNDLVTVADLASEKALTARLQDLLPGSVVVGEEAVAADPAVTSRLSGDAPVWVIDPVDGTWNFVHGNPKFGVLIALVVGNQTQAGWMYSPVHDLLYTTERGQGTWLLGDRLQVLPAAPLPDMIGSISPYGISDQDRDQILQRLGGAPQNYQSPRCAAHDFMELLTRQKHFLTGWNLTPWDHAAGVLACQEAGAFVAKPDATPYLPTDRKGGLLVAPDAASWTVLQRAIRP
jgi:fructose-1,6-bisphosphatase/inositol monophosphatase family enzyme